MQDKLHFQLAEGHLIGSIESVTVVPSHAPSERPSSSPTSSTEPTVEPSLGPTLSFEPTLNPSYEVNVPCFLCKLHRVKSDRYLFKPSEMPSGHPTGAPSVSLLPSPFPSISQRPTFPDWPSSSPSTSLGPSRLPSSHPTTSPLPTKSQGATFLQPANPATSHAMPLFQASVLSVGFLGVLVPILKTFIYS